MKLNKSSFTIIAIALICVIFLFGIEDINMQTVKVWITPIHGKDHCVIEVKANGVLKMTSGDLSTEMLGNNFESESFFAEDAKKRKNIN